MQMDTIRSLQVSEMNLNADVYCDLDNNNKPPFNLDTRTNYY